MVLTGDYTCPEFTDHKILLNSVSTWIVLKFQATKFFGGMENLLLNKAKFRAFHADLIFYKNLYICLEKFPELCPRNFNVIKICEEFSLKIRKK